MEETRPNHRPPKERIIDPEALERDFYTLHEVADLLGFHYNTIRRMVKNGELPAVKLGKAWRVRKLDLERFTDPNRAQSEKDMG